MRVIAVVLLSVGSAGVAHGSAPCEWVASDVPPALLWERVVTFRRTYRCPAEARGDARVVISMASGGGQKTIAEESASIEPRGRWPRIGVMSAKAFPSAYCEAGALRGRRHLVGPPGAERLVRDVPLATTVIGTGDMAGLSGRFEAVAFCEACERIDGSFSVSEDGSYASRLGPGTRVRAQVSQASFECIGQEATLSMRIFAAGDRGDLSTAIRPVWTLDSLEHRFQCRAGSCLLDFPAPYEALCTKLGRGEHSLAWELAGRGELARLGGGRSTLDLRCR